MFEIEVSHTFCASHQLRLPDGSLEPLHGHNWHLVVCVGCEKLDAMDCVCDFHALHARLIAVTDAWNNRHLNDVAPFSQGTNPSAERVAQAIARAIELEPGAVLKWVSVTEAPGCLARYCP